MATIVLSAVGAAVGGSIGGSVLGLSAAVIGRAVGATVGRVIDQKLLGTGSGVVETGKVERFRLMGASEGAPVGQVWGRTRVAGQVIWATRFLETVSRSGGSGKGAPKQPETRSYSYSISMAVALCEGEITRVGRIWADGVEVARDMLNMRVYAGSEDQLPDPKIAAVEGAAFAPAYRGIAYVVFEDLDLTPFGNRIPQMTFEVVRPARGGSGAPAGLRDLLQGVALVPGTGEYLLATTPVHYSEAPGVNRTANVHASAGGTDFTVSMDALADELPQVQSVVTVVSWFANDLRCASCEIRPKVEQTQVDGVGMPWQVSGVTRAQAQVIPQLDGASIYGGTPADRSVMEALISIRERGQKAVFYPFLLMEQLPGNLLPDPLTGGTGQPALPWRGRITTSLAPGLAGSPDGSAAAVAEVAAFFGTAQPNQFVTGPSGVTYTGPADWGLRRMILHYAHLCVAAGGVDAFCIGSEMRGLTQIRGPGGTFPAVAALKTLAADVRSILGPATRIGYAADWTEYFGYQPQDGSGNVYFHLDPLWSDPNIDFIGIDNYMPVSDWRDGDDHADASFGSIYALDYLRANVEGGEGYDWYYDSEAGRAFQVRLPIEDGAYGEPWIFRYKDIRSWWSNPHHERIGGVRQPSPTAWVPRSKPVWFTELGCPALDKATNEPNKFLDAKSSESALPRFSNGTRDDLIQAQYYRAVLGHWGEPGVNPVSDVYGGPMIDLARAHAWAWDARPFPQFPALSDLWTDAGNYRRGHWLNGRTSAQALGSVVAEICGRSGVDEVDVEGLFGLVRGYSVSDVDGARAVLQPLMLAYGFEAIERDGILIFRNRGRRPDRDIVPDDLAMTDEQRGTIETVRAPAAEVAGRVRLTHVEADGDYEARTAEAIFPDERTLSVSTSELPLVLTVAEGRAIVERWLAESRVARDAVRFALPPSALATGAGDVVRLLVGDTSATYRIDRVEQAGASLIEAVRVEAETQVPSDAVEENAGLRPFAPPLPVYPQFLDLPLLTGVEVPHAPHLAVAADPWPGSVAVYSSATGDAGYELNTLIGQGAVVGVTETVLPAAISGLVDRGEPLRVRIGSGTLASATEAALLAGANLAAIGDGSAANWELFQFRDAELVAPGVYELSVRLRGQLGTDGLMPEEWPAGSSFVLVNGALEQIDLPVSARGLVRSYRIGPGQRTNDDPSFVEVVEAFDGAGLRPYAPAHLRAARLPNGDLAVTWIRRTRIDGDSWASVEVPLGEEGELYAVRVVQTATILREASVTTPAYIYTAAAQAADAAAPGFAIEIAQVSQTFGPGPYTRIIIDA
ncbi:MAG: glycoside hydrolase/phage tail family protein [Rhodobacteraceae bacterium]|nr:glycoside hydrolase/phage tail family protein [Paracoccaceae bacterium]